MRAHACFQAALWEPALLSAQRSRYVCWVVLLAVGCCACSSCALGAGPPLQCAGASQPLACVGRRCFKNNSHACQAPPPCMRSPHPAGVHPMGPGGRVLAECISESFQRALGAAGGGGSSGAREAAPEAAGGGGRGGEEAGAEDEEALWKKEGDAEAEAAAKRPGDSEAAGEEGVARARPSAGGAAAEGGAGGGAAQLGTADDEEGEPSGAGEGAAARPGSEGEEGGDDGLALGEDELQK